MLVRKILDNCLISNLITCTKYYQVIYSHAVLLSCNQTEASTLTRLVLCISVLHSCALFSYRTRDTHDCLVHCSFL
ncbi:hypothetical protein M6B38_404365 [Iris pallida]|uniref:Uncharacterized protein n=1 Tax=Iris pallida TaxID=29817 RepID=A0AAX6FRA5_IRIPA|nr:hypothetical protein M6B38_404365 [Iris pallida]